MIIGGVTLDNDMYWTDEFQDNLIGGTATRALDGHLSVQAYTLSGGQRMTLSGEATSGWQSRTTVLALQALRNDPSQIITVTLPDDRVFQTTLRVEEENPISFVPVTTASAPGPSMWYYGTISLRII